MSDVIDLKAEKEKRKGKEEGPSKAEICYRAAAAMIGRAMDWDPFPAHLEMIKPERSEPYYIQVFLDRDGEPDYCQPVFQLDVETMILKYFSTNRCTSGVAVTPADCRMVFEFWQRMAKPFAQPISPVLFKSQSGLTWKRLEFDPDARATPTFDELMSRTGSSDVVMAFIGSLFVEQADRQQWLCIHGKGQNGKSRLAAFLARCLGNAAQTAKPPRGEAKFWNAQLLGRRLITFADCADLKFLSDANFKSLTGADRVPIERKGKDIFDAAISCKFLIISNEKPKIENAVSDIRRALYSEIGPFGGSLISTDTYDQLMWSEAPGIIYKCLEAYKKLTPKHGPIPFSSEAFEDMVSEAEEEMEHRARRWFNLWPPGTHDATPFCNRPFIKPEYMMLMKSYERLGDKEYEKFKVFLERTYGIHRRRVQADGKRSYRYLNCEENPKHPYSPDEKIGKDE